MPCGLQVPFTLNIEAVRSPETLVTTYKTTQRRNPEDHNRCESVFSSFVSFMGIIKLSVSCIIIFLLQYFLFNINVITFSLHKAVSYPLGSLHKIFLRIMLLDGPF
jgi:hypothetical protein